MIRLWDSDFDLISKKSGITDSINYNFAISRIDSYDYLPVERI